MNDVAQKSNVDESNVDDESTEDPTVLLVREGDLAADYIERLLDITDTDGDIDLDVKDDRAMVAVVGTGLKDLVGPRGSTLEALQELTRLAVSQQTGVRSRLMLDIGGYRETRRAELVSLAKDSIEQVQQTSEPARLVAMNAFERKIVHDQVAAAGLRSESEGDDPDRRVVIFPDADGA